MSREWAQTVRRMHRLVGAMHPIRAWIEATDSQDWQTEVVRSQDGQRNCLLGHIFEWGRAQAGRLSYAGDPDRLGSLALTSSPA